MIWVAPYPEEDKLGLILADDVTNRYYYSAWGLNDQPSLMTNYQKGDGSTIIERFTNHIRKFQLESFSGFQPCPSAVSVIDFDAVYSSHPEFLL